MASLDGVKIASDAGERSKDFAAAPIARFVKPNFCEFLTATARNIGNALILRKIHFCINNDHFYLQKQIRSERTMIIVMHLTVVHFECIWKASKLKKAQERSQVQVKSLIFRRR